jgi:DNA-binding beta-propeller fold protein YncE
MKSKIFSISFIALLLCTLLVFSTVPVFAAKPGTLESYTIGNKPQAVCFDGTYIWVANGDSDNITKIQASNGKVRGTYDSGDRPFGLCYDGSNVWVINLLSNNVYKFRARDGELLGVYPVVNPTGICFDGENIWW